MARCGSIGGVDVVVCSVGGVRPSEYVEFVCTVRSVALDVYRPNSICPCRLAFLNVQGRYVPGAWAAVKVGAVDGPFFFFFFLLPLDAFGVGFEPGTPHGAGYVKAKPFIRNL